MTLVLYVIFNFNILNRATTSHQFEFNFNHLLLLANKKKKKKHVSTRPLSVKLSKELKINYEYSRNYNTVIHHNIIIQARAKLSINYKR